VGGNHRQTATAPNAPDHAVLDAQLDRILEVIGLSWAKSTKETYGVGLLVFHVYCNTHGIEENRCCPVAPNLLLAFLSSCACLYSGSTLANYAAALRAWHLLHGRVWAIEPNELKAILDRATALAPPSLKRLKRAPFTPKFICKICSQLDLSSLLDTAVFACLTTTFYCIARLGEFTVLRIKDKFDPSKYIL
jgi:hypothetical protein